MTDRFDENNCDSHEDQEAGDVYGDPEGEALFANYDRSDLQYDYFGRVLGPPAIPEFIVCPFDGLGGRSTKVVHWDRRQTDHPEDTFFCKCKLGHEWSLLTKPHREYKLPPHPLMPNPIPRPPREEEVPRDISSLFAITCPFCLFGRLVGTQVLSVGASFMDSSHTFVCCRCDNDHQWSILVKFGDRDKRLPTKWPIWGSDYFDKDGNIKEPSFDLNAALHEVQLIIEGKDGLEP